MGVFDNLVPAASNTPPTAQQALSASSFDPMRMIIAVAVLCGFAIIGLIIWQIYSIFME